ncbi:terminase large subunit [Nocardioides sp. NBC_00368]|uniref:terminase large subunit domain-containing protein n=1 Tax=Nocardioides sp. NBC_00368 TaxID=2976000 RepID=UPI002E21C77C
MAEYSFTHWDSETMLLPKEMPKPLCENPVSDGPLLRQLVELVRPGFKFDPWQAALIDHVLERYPDDWHDAKKRGRLRFRQVVIMVPRQVGKTEIAAAFALWSLALHGEKPMMYSIASTREQAEILFRRVKSMIDSQPALTKRFIATGTRGIRARKGDGGYEVRAGKEDALQGLPGVFVADELHLHKDIGSWQALVLGTSSLLDGQVLGISTAGDDDSDALRHLMEEGRRQQERFGFWYWFTPEGIEKEDPRFVLESNPAVHCGRIDLDEAMERVSSMPDAQAIRYVANRFVAQDNPWMPPQMWMQLPTAEVDLKSRVVFAVERTPSWTAATITAAYKREDGVIVTEVVASLVNPTQKVLEEKILALHRKYKPLKVFMRSASLKDLSDALRKRAVKTEFVTQAQLIPRYQSFFAAVQQKRVEHAHDEVVKRQLPSAVAKNSGDGYVLDNRASDIDAVISTVLAVTGAETTEIPAPQVLVVHT